MQHFQHINLQSHLTDEADISDSDRETPSTAQNDPDSEAMAAQVSSPWVPVSVSDVLYPRQLRTILERTGPLNLFRFFINPFHFGQSVENLYYLSFLFRDGLCTLELTDSNEPILCEQPVEFSNRTLITRSSPSTLELYILGQERQQEPNGDGI
jgi:hypothetical protein